MRGLLLAVLVLVLSLVGVVVCAIDDGSSSAKNQYVLDGKTTYCFIINQSMNEDRLDRSKLGQQASGEQCPLDIQLKMSSTSSKLLPNQVVTFTWSVFHVLRPNIMQIAETIPMVNQRAVPTQIPHSNLHYCAGENKCDMFNAMNSTDQQYANFSGTMALFNDQVGFPHGGQYTIFAHVVLAPNDGDYNSSQYHFAAFLPVTVAKVDEQDKDFSDTSTTGMSTGTLVIVMVGGAIVVLVIIGVAVFYRRKQTAQQADPLSNSGFMPGASTAKGSSGHHHHHHGPYPMGGGGMDNGMNNDELTYPWKNNGYPPSVHSNASDRSGTSRHNTGPYQQFNVSSMNVNNNAPNTISSSGSYRGGGTVNGDNPDHQYGAYGGNAHAGPYDSYGMYDAYNTPTAMRNSEFDAQCGMAMGMAQGPMMATDKGDKVRVSKGPSTGAVAAGVAAAAAVGFAAGALAASDNKDKNFETNSNKSMGLGDEDDDEDDLTRSYGTEDYASSPFQVDDDRPDSINSDLSSLTDYSVPLRQKVVRNESSDSELSKSSSILTQDLDSFAITQEYYRQGPGHKRTIDDLAEGEEQESSFVCDLNDTLEGRGSDESDGTVDFTEGSSRGLSAFEVEKLRAAVGRQPRRNNSDMDVLSEHSDEENYEF